MGGAPFLAEHALSLIHEGTVLWRGEGPGGARVIKVSERVKVKSNRV